MLQHCAHADTHKKRNLIFAYFDFELYATENVTPF